MKIDIYAHILPEKYLAAFREKVKPGTKFMEANNRANCEIDVRLRLMDRYPDVLQVLTVSLPPLDMYVTPGNAAELARIANDELAELVDRYPDKFIAAVACLPLNDMEAALEETDRAITKLGLKGIQIFTNTSREPLDIPKFRPLFEKMATYDLPIWIHPCEGKTMYEPIFGPVSETATTMLRLVLAGIFKDFPDIKFITHHCGSMAPYFEGRIRYLLPHILEMGHPILGKDLPIRNPEEDFRKFYTDTAVYGNTAALMCGYDFLGADKILFGTDAPLGHKYGLTIEIIQSVDRMDIPDTDREKIFKQNAVKLLRVAI